MTESAQPPPFRAEEPNATPAGNPALSRVPVYLSAFVYPGVGQASQKRWAAAVAYGLGFTACFALFALCAGRILIAFYGLAFSPNPVDARDLPTLEMVLSGLLCLVVYLVNVFDAFLAFRRFRSRAARARLDQRLGELESRSGGIKSSSAG